MHNYYDVSTFAPIANQFQKTAPSPSNVLDGLGRVQWITSV